MRREAVIRAGLDRQPDALGVRVLGRGDGVGDVGAARTAQGVVQVTHEPVAILRRQRHERAPHQDVLNLVHAVTQPAQLVHPSARLNVRVVPRAYRAHARRLVPGVRLRGVLEIAVGTSGAVDADVSSRRDVGAPMGLGHDGDDGDARRGSHGFGAELREKGFAVLVGHGADELDELRRPLQAVPSGGFVLDGVEVDDLAVPDGVDHDAHHVRYGAHPRLLLRHGDDAHAEVGLPSLRARVRSIDSPRAHEE
mmetsp:Transcript_9961/g.38864  ORF Transcript_9961/g.38864 Transcript_9961/m.38864 type:complete len:252 (-) Transcript_9961:18-773(-)